MESVWVQSLRIRGIRVSSQLNLRSTNARNVCILETLKPLGRAFCHPESVKGSESRLPRGRAAGSRGLGLLADLRSFLTRSRLREWGERIVSSKASSRGSGAGPGRGDQCGLAGQTGPVKTQFALDGVRKDRSVAKVENPAGCEQRGVGVEVAGANVESVFEPERS